MGSAGAGSDPGTAPGPTARDDPIPHTGRLLAIDWGMKRIGVAVSDPSQTIAQPLAVLRRRQGRRFPLQQLRPHLDAQAPVGVIVGLPLESGGHEGAAAQEARAAGGLVAEKTGLPVTYWDERMSTARALRSARERHGTGRIPPGDLDRLAATVILQAYLDSRRS